jgi:ABC-type microcin C transport system permease subunit YejB
LNQKAVSLPLVVFGVLLIVIACGVAVYNMSMVREQVTANVSMLQIFSDYFFRFGIAILLTIIGSVTVGLGLRR